MRAVFPALRANHFEQSEAYDCEDDRSTGFYGQDERDRRQNGRLASGQASKIKGLD
jgi:hypothetical protein